MLVSFGMLLVLMGRYLHNFSKWFRDRFLFGVVYKEQIRKQANEYLANNINLE